MISVNNNPLVWKLVKFFILHIGWAVGDFLSERGFSQPGEGEIVS
jgi:hypothetical protein